jgi:hypothetical protein
MRRRRHLEDDPRLVDGDPCCAVRKGSEEEEEEGGRGDVRELESRSGSALCEAGRRRGRLVCGFGEFW